MEVSGETRHRYRYEMWGAVGYDHLWLRGTDFVPQLRPKDSLWARPHEHSSAEILDGAAHCGDQSSPMNDVVYGPSAALSRRICSQRNGDRICAHPEIGEAPNLGAISPCAMECMPHAIAPAFR